MRQPSVVRGFLLGGLVLIACLAAWRGASVAAADPLAERFSQVDRDRDGRVTPEEFPHDELFQQIDTNQDGVVTLDETRAAWAAGKLKNLRLAGRGAMAKTKQMPTDARFAGISTELREAPQALKPGEQGIGRRIADLAFVDVQGKEHRLSDLANQQAVVLVMTSTGCPLCQKYAPTLAKLEQQYGPQGIAFVFINTIASESENEVQRAIQAHGFQGPYVRDVDYEIAKYLRATTTTEAFVLDRARTLVYRGAVDDQYGLGYAKDAPQRSYLAEALDRILAGMQPDVAATTAPGCDLLWATAGESSQMTASVTYHNRISRILQNHCLECHRDQGLAPFALDSYESVTDYAGMIRRVVDQKTMPPWFAAPLDDSEAAGKRVHWANDRSLSELERRDLIHWIDAGRPVGDSTDAPVPRKFANDWAIGRPDLVLQIPEPISIKASGRMPYQHVRIATPFPEDRWVQAVEIRPTDRAVVHHVLVFARDGQSRGGGIDERAGFFAAYVPGNTYQQFPAGFAKRLPAGANLVFQLHYTPNGTASSDQTEIGLIFAKEPPRHEIQNIGISNGRIEIPPGAPHHAEQAALTVPSNVQLLAFMPHMHLRGKAFRFDLVTPAGDRQQLLDVPRYDFNWQLEYRLAEPLEVAEGSRIEVTGWFDNSAGNPANPDPTKTIRWGPQTEDEMLLGYVEYYSPDTR